VSRNPLGFNSLSYEGGIQSGEGEKRWDEVIPYKGRRLVTEATRRESARIGFVKVGTGMKAVGG